MNSYLSAMKDIRLAITSNWIIHLTNVDASFSWVVLCKYRRIKFSLIHVKNAAECFLQLFSDVKNEDILSTVQWSQWPWLSHDDQVPFLLSLSIACLISSLQKAEILSLFYLHAWFNTVELSTLHFTGIWMIIQTMIFVVNTHQSQLLYSCSKTGSTAHHDILVTLPLHSGNLNFPLAPVEERIVYRAGIYCNAQQEQHASNHLT